MTMSPGMVSYMLPAVHTWPITCDNVYSQYNCFIEIGVDMV